MKNQLKNTLNRISLIILVLASFFIFNPTDTANAAPGSCRPGGISFDTQWSISPTTVEQGGTVTVTINTPDIDGETYYVVVGATLSGSNMGSHVAYAPITINLDGTATVTIPETQNLGQVSIAVFDSISGQTYKCTRDGNLNIIRKQDNCGQLGQACCTGATQKKCDENFTDNGLKLVCNPQNVCILGDDPIGATPEPTIAEISRGCPRTDEINTAIGCIPFGSSSALVTFFVSWGLGISGGVAMLSLIYSAFMIMTSAGDPKRLEMGREMVVSSLSGIVLIAFSVFMLRLIGIDILGLFI